jgi:hypothetical protein
MPETTWIRIFDLLDFKTSFFSCVSIVFASS